MKLPIWQYIINKLKTALAIVQDTDTATRAISQGKYVLWKGNLCQASSAIAQDDTLSASNLTALSDGIANVLGDHIVTDEDVTSQLIFNENFGADKSYTKVFKNKGTNIVYASFYGTVSATVAGTVTLINVLPSPTNTSFNFVLIDYFGGTGTPVAAYIDSGALKLRGALEAGHTLMGSAVYMA